MRRASSPYCCVRCSFAETRSPREGTSEPQIILEPEYRDVDLLGTGPLGAMWVPIALGSTHVLVLVKERRIIVGLTSTEVAGTA